MCAKRFFLELGSTLSRLLNVLLGGTADMTFSARCHIEGLRAEYYIDWVFFVLTGNAKHCEVWWDEEVRRAVDNVHLDALKKGDNSTQG